MITGFEKYTAQLNDTELKALHYIVPRLKNNRGEAQVVTNDKIQQALQEVGMKVSGPRIRKIIHVIRVAGIIRRLKATGRGYYVAETLTELREYDKSLEERIAHQQTLRESVQRDIHEWQMSMQGRLGL